MLGPLACEIELLAVVVEGVGLAEGFDTLLVVGLALLEAVVDKRDCTGGSFSFFTAGRVASEVREVVGAAGLATVDADGFASPDSLDVVVAVDILFDSPLAATFFSSAVSWSEEIDVLDPWVRRRVVDDAAV